MEFVACFGGNCNPLGRFCILHKAHTFNMYVSHILFWAIALPEVLQTGIDYTYGYKEALAANKNAYMGKIQSGRFGSGAFPMIFMCTLVASGIFLQAMFVYCTAEEETGGDDDDNAPITNPVGETKN